MKTTLNAIRATHPCEEGWAVLLKHLGKTKADDEPLDFLTILESNGPDDALWCLRAYKGNHRDMRKLAAELVRVICDEPIPEVEALMAAAYSDLPDREYLRLLEDRYEDLCECGLSVTAKQNSQRRRALGIAADDPYIAPYMASESMYDGNVVQALANQTRILLKFFRMTP